MEQIETQANDESRTNEFVGGSGSAILSLNAMVAEIAPTDIPVLLIGESGTGKNSLCPAHPQTVPPETLPVPYDQLFFSGRGGVANAACRFIP